LQIVSQEAIRAPVSLFSRLAPGTIAILVAGPVAPAKGRSADDGGFPDENGDRPVWPIAADRDC